ncbi:hypothetical protein [Klenkia taihuensis]|uniref:Uncharacterized protein n=1 Tax=Klenkia taihuensis TaxID=1225127 RepID=A0A1I1Q8L9_9ACTN|nr:hypothetical protein [Klenkia taihuensis]GHE08379.1 hypothetical protein GCM10011381_08930 [Klenkia taihuensis]SFD14470.1 hypothetical protein SAMN05661030_2482 [Klenkia taihuensis]
MTTPRWWSQPFPPTGAIASEGIRNQLGRPPVDPLTVFVRETAQNSWDARLPGVETTYRLELTSVAPAHRPNWERLLTPPISVQDHLGVGRVVRTANLRLLSVVDRGTKGLGGPTRADQLAEGRRDWISFVLNVGEKRDTAQGGGTYGYGKAVLYRLSRVGTILVYTRTAGEDNVLNSRLIGIALGSSFDSRERVDQESRPFTGRHWWGDVQEGHVEPLIGEDADEVARALGLTLFAPGESGTTLVVIDPDLDHLEDVDQAADHLAETISWQLWPIMLPERGTERLVPEVTANGRSFAPPDPARSYPLRMFVSAYRRLPTDAARTLECRNPRQRLGRFALDRQVVVPMQPNAVSLAASFAGVDGDPHHVCLMRSPELVVRYHEGPTTSSVHSVYAGVFRADDELDDVYAAAEPPTHDNWVFEQLTGTERTFVRVTFQRLREVLGVFRAPTQGAASTSSRTALGAVSNYLGGLVASAFASPADQTPTTPGERRKGSARSSIGESGSGTGETGPQKPGTSSRTRIVTIVEPHVEDDAGSVVLIARYAVTAQGPVRLEARLSIATLEGREDDPPAGAARPRVKHWRTVDGVVAANACVVDGPTEVDLVVVPVADTATDISVIATSPADDAVEVSR